MKHKLMIVVWVAFQLITMGQAKAADVKPKRNFGDGIFGTGTTITHYYAAAGTYVVSLTVYSINRDGEICECKEKVTNRVDVSNCIAGKSSRAQMAKASTSAKTVEAKTEKSSIFLTAKPNPFTQTLFVKVSGFVPSRLSAVGGERARVRSHYTLAVLNSAGATIATQSIKPNSTLELNTASYPAGVYLLTLKGSDGITKSTQVVKVNQ